MIYQSYMNFDGHKQRIFLSLENKAQLKSTVFHRHKFNEFFFLEKGWLSYEIEGEEYHLKAGNLLVIPANILHRCTGCSVEHSYFHMMTDGFIPKTVLNECDIDVINEIVKISEKFDKKNIFKLRTFITFLCYDVLQSERFEISEQLDYDFLIDKNIWFKTSIEELAEILGTSIRHAERLVLKHTGKTFNQYRLGFRMSAAKELLEKGTLSKKEIAEYVGYDSYKGFKKAYDKYFDELK